jgi:hypothetical protein
MLSVAKLRRKPKHFHNFSGLTVEKFDELLLAVEPVYRQAELKRLAQRERQRAIGGGRNFKCGCGIVL